MPDDSLPTSILDDLPADRDALDFGPYIATLADIIASPATRTPLTIGVFGTWGSGKTSLLRMVRARLPKSFRVAWFDAWKYERETTLWRALLLQVLTALREAVPANEADALTELDDLETALYRAVDREEMGGVTIDWGKLGLGLGEGAVQIGLAFLPGGGVLTDLLKELRAKDKSEAAISKIIAAIHRERSKIHIEQVQFLEQFHDRFNRLVAAHILKKNLRLVVFVDDLDRCLPEKAVEALEAIKLFVDAPGCVFVLALDQDVIARGIQIKYREFGLAADAPGNVGATLAVAHDEGRRFVIDGTRYLEKIIQLPFQIPPIEQGDMGAFVSKLVGEWPHPDCPEVFAEGLGRNPRQVKRVVNVFLLLWQLAGKRAEKLQGQIKPVRLAKVVTLQHVYPELYELLKETPRLLRDLEDYYRAETPSARGSDPLVGAGGKPTAEPPQRVEPPPVLAPFVSRAAVRRLLTLHPPEMPEANFTGLTPDDLRLYFTLTRRAEAPQAAPAAPPRATFEPQMVRIPAGPFLMGSTDEQIKQAIASGLDKDWAARERPQHTVELSEYFIGKYPVTNTEYQAFVREAGYKSPQGWDGDKYPEGKSDHPVVNVSWDDAVAYCKWLSEKTGKTYRLPTEAEWEKAARSTDGRIYPWGNEWDPKKLNSKEGGPGDTTPVGQYSPAGDSPYGAADMSGNVWEWTNSKREKYPYDANDGREDGKGDVFVLRGGAWDLSVSYARAACRSGIHRVLPWYNLGFRVGSASPVSRF